MSLFKAFKVYKGQHLGNLLFDFSLRDVADSETVRYVFEYIVVREKSVTLKNGVNLTLVRRNTTHVL